MRLYHFQIFSRVVWRLLAGFALLLSGCATLNVNPAPQNTQALITINLLADGQTITLSLPAGSSVQQALDAARVSLNALDRTEPPAYTVLGPGDQVLVVRVVESFEVIEEDIPFERQLLRNESLPQDQELLIQAGRNGKREITYRRVFENGVEISSQPIPVKAVIVESPTPEIIMLGVQAPFAPLSIPGRLFYLRDGNLWVLEGSTAVRRALIATGDLDGRVLSFADDGRWLLFTRQDERASEEEPINSLWAVDLSPALEAPSGAAGVELEFIDLNVPNVIHFAGWMPGSNTRAYFSTVEPRSAAPGWQGNNDLNYLNFSTTGWTSNWAILIEPNAGGIYGWWGSSFAWAPQGFSMAFARPDGLGIVDLRTGETEMKLDILPLRTRGDWAWSPGFTWSPDARFLYAVEHSAPPGSSSPEESPIFDLTVVPLQGGPILRLASQVGMFAYPLASPFQTLPSGDQEYQLAFLQAIFPAQSESSRYRLAVIDRDGSDRQVLFPAEDAAGLDPQQHWGAWSPAPMPDSGRYAIAVLYNGNLWLVDSLSGKAVQVTGDGLTSRVVWLDISQTTGEE